MAALTFSSDYGPTDHYVGVCHAVIARVAPDVRVIDITHGLRSIRHGTVVLKQSLPFADAAVHLAVVDPGVGTDRRGVVVTTLSGAVLVGPDNGLLSSVAESFGGVASAFELLNPDYRLEFVSSTFHGRDVFAPAAAHVALGVAPEDFGPPVRDLIALPPPRMQVSDGRLDAEVAFVDWYGNVELTATQDYLDASGLRDRVTISCAAGDFDAVVGRTFADAERGGLVVYVASGGFVAIARNGGRANDLLHDPDEVTVTGKA